MDKFHVFVYMLMRDASLKQRIPCIMRISIFGAFSAGKKCALYTGKYGKYVSLSLWPRITVFELKITYILKSNGCGLEKSELPWQQNVL